MHASLDDPDRLRALSGSGLMDSEPEEAFERFTRLACRLLEVPVVLVSLVDDRRQFFKSSVGLALRETPLSHSFCQHVVVDRRPLVVTDARSDARVAENLAVRDLQVVAYLGVPLTTSDGHTLGSLCAIDHAPRDWREDDLRVLEDLAQGVMSEIELRASRERLALTLEHAPIGMALVALDGHWLQVNQALCEITGYAEHELLGLTFQDLTHPDDLAMDLELVRQLLAGERRSHQLEKRYLHRDGAVIWIRLSVALACDGAGRPVHFVAQLQDITAARATQQALADSETVLSAIIENAPAGIMVRDLDGRYRRANAYAAQTLGIPAEAVPGRSPEDFFPKEAAAAIRAHDALVLARGEAVSEEITVPRATGEDCTYQTVKYPIRDPAGAVVGLGSFSLDITARKRIEQELQKSELKLREAQELACLGSWELDVVDGRLRWSDELCRIFGQPLGFAPTIDEFVGLVHPQDREHMRRRIPDVLAGSFGASDYRIVRPDGEIRHVHTRSFGRLGQRGAMIEIWGTTQDVTDQVLVQEELSAARERAQAIITGMREGYALTVDGEIVEVNDSLCRMTGFGRDELIGVGPPYPFWLPELLDETLAVRDRIVATQGGTFEVTLRRKDGSRFEAEITAEAARRADGTLLGFVNTLRDISEAKRHRTELERERHALHAAQHMAHVGSWDYDLRNDAPGHWSLELWRMLGREPEPVAPRLPEFMAMIEAEDRERVAGRIARAMAERQPFTEEFGMVAADGRSLRVAFQAQGSTDEDGQPLRANGTIQDITERYHREREEVAVREIAQLVAQAAGPAAVFEQVARAVCGVFQAHSGVVVRYDEAAGKAVFVNAQAHDGQSLAGTELDLDGTSAPATVYRTGRAARTGGAPSTGYNPEFAPVVARLTDAVAAPITVGGALWGCLAAGFSRGSAPADTERRLDRFAELVGMAIANAEAWEVLARQAATDSLTGLANHRTFVERLATEVARARRYRRALSLVLFDLDRFKAINDTYGHQVGDEVLTEVARRLRDHAREGELLARVGGEEFAWLMPETGPDAAYLAAERMRRAIESAPFHTVGTLTVSAGVSTTEHDLDADGLVRFADRALYWAKDGGRNQTCVHPHEEQTPQT